MIRNLKALGLAVVALLAMGAFMASSASAHTPALFHSESEKTTLTAEQETNQVFKAAGDTITCEEARFEGTTSAKTVEEISVEPKETTAKAGEIGYGKCKFIVKVTVNMKSCYYVFHASGTVDIECTKAGDKISYKASFLGSSCTVEIGAQTGLEKVEYTNKGVGTGQEITVDANVQGITYDATGGLCGKTGHFADGVYEGSATVTGEVDGTTNMTGIWWTATVA